jgi:thiol-disulfide isomerase/thioredoxin
VRSLAAALVLLAASAAAAPPTVLDLRVVAGDGTTRPLRAVVADAPAVVAFWATWCPPCRAEVPALNRAFATWRERGLRVIGVALDPDPATIDAARETWGIRYEVVRVAPGEGARKAALFPRGLPVTAFVARGAATLHERMLEDETLDARIPALLSPPGQ